MAQNKGYMAKIGLDTSDVDKKMRSLTSELRQIDRALKDNGDSAELNAQKYTVLQQQLAAAQKKLQQLQQQEAAAKEALNNGQINDAEYRAYRREVENTTRALGDLEQQLEELDHPLDNHADDLKDATKAASDWLEVFKGNLASVAVQKLGDLMVQLGQKTVEFVQDATAAYGQYEQLVGGIETLFSGAEDIVAENAKNAYKTAQISANQYMEQITSFAASMVGSLEGDTREAAKYADMAIRDMADNAMKMGTDLQSIQNAYQGFAKQNYTMLDNLKLGYGGNKTEMERLIADANKLKEANGEVGDLTIEKFSDVAEAIHLVQENMGMAGQAADEAAGTIEGSAASAQAAWENLLAGIADPTADLDKLIDDFVTAKTAEIQNLLPTVENTIEGVGKAIDKLMPELDGAGEELANMMTQDMIPGAIEALKWFIKNYDKVATGIKMIVAAIAIDKTASFVGNLGDLASKLTDVSGGADKALPSLEKFAGFLTSDLSTAATTAKTAITTSAAETAAGIETAAATSTAALLPYIAIIAAVTVAALAAADAIDKMGDKMVEESQYWNGYSDSMNDANDRYAKLSNTSQEEAAEMAKAWVDADKEKLQSTRETLAGLERSLSEMDKLSDEEIDWNVYNSLYQQAEQAKRDIQSLENLVFQEEKLLDKKADAEEKAATKAKTSATYEDFLRTQSDTREQIDENFAETLADVEKEWDVLYHYDKKSRDEYWENRRRYLETHKNNSEAWWKAWNETEKYYADKAAKDEK